MDAEKKTKKEEVSEEAKEKISERLSRLENLWFPRALEFTITLPSERKAIFIDLLSRDAALFLKRYGSQLTNNELNEFNSMKDDYEINWHVNRLRRVLSPTTEELVIRSVRVKNRRHAYLDRFVIGGQYFSEESMREREPYFHEYVGKFQDQSGRGMARPSERWYETLLRRCEEADLVAKIRGEQQRIVVPERDWVGNEKKKKKKRTHRSCQNKHGSCPSFSFYKKKKLCFRRLPLIRSIRFLLQSILNSTHFKTVPISHQLTFQNVVQSC